MRMFFMFTAGAGMGRCTRTVSPGRKALSANFMLARSRMCRAAKPFSSISRAVSFSSFFSGLSSAGGSPARWAI